ncbi:MAG: M23 family metallopeptidase [Corynebacterium sp.]|uniref:Peptidase family M23 n=1 Tax=Corynebacterium mustelae TaxID=571915 RepID=A0A0G3GVV8_9CORY|nr:MULTISPECIES: M23 family metallopeptidase [Corynebacterium]AKK05316.1 Peptidase family M23 [Corynebacterium mustelae]MDO5097313.1 M23 family metallopeptidase [Corynebacterium sp.]
MQQTRPNNGGKHRKQTTPIKGRVAFVAAATGVVSTAGATGAALAHTAQAETVGIQLASNDLPAIGSSAPQILAIAEFKPVVNLHDQLNKAIAYSQELAQADEAARTPKVSVARPAEGVFTSGFGPRWGSFHAGIDIANAVGTPILAVMDGTVIDSGPASGYGNWIRIKHDDGSMSVYGHMETLAVAVGQRVQAGQNIAGMGNRGYSTGSHLHFEIHPTGNGAVDPVSWFAERGITIS